MGKSVGTDGAMSGCMGGRATIYLRVSKGERHTDNQRPDIEHVVSMRGLELVAEYAVPGAVEHADTREAARPVAGESSRRQLDLPLIRFADVSSWFGRRSRK